MAEMTNKKRILSLDILRGMVIAWMIFGNDQANEETMFAPIRHAEWFGLTISDLIFPFFMCIMGITTYMSLQRYHFTWSRECALRIVRRALCIWGVGLGLTLMLTVADGVADPLGHVRFPGVLARFAICYALTAAIALSMRHQHIPYLIGAIYIGYYILLLMGNGFAHDETSILDIVDKAVFGANHLYTLDTGSGGLAQYVPCTSTHACRILPRARVNGTRGAG